MNTYAYRIYKNIPNNPVIGGTVKGENMEHATQKVIKNNGVQVIHEFLHGYEHHYFMFRDSKVGILLYINPEEF